MASDERQKTTRKAGGKSASPAPGDRQVGDALRTVYEQTVSETIPPEMLELLGKLG